MAAAAATAEPRHIGQTLSGKLGWPWALVPLRESGLPARQTARRVALALFWTVFSSRARYGCGPAQAPGIFIDGAHRKTRISDPS